MTEIGNDGAGIEPRYVEQPVEQTAEPAPARLDLVEKLDLRCILRSLAQGGQEEALGVQRLGEVVTGRGQKPRLFLARLLQRFVLPRQGFHQASVVFDGDGVPRGDLDPRRG